MKLMELQLIDILRDLRDSHCVVGVKAEFEAEGTRTEELMRLKEICLAAKVPLTLKIGGCEALRDMYDARSIGVNCLVAPMVETPFALRKYLRAIDIVFPKDEQNKIDFLINVETLMAFQNFAQMLEIPEIEKLNGIVVGRVDLVGSMGKDRSACESEQVFSMAKNLALLAKKKKMSVVIGGAISNTSLPFLRMFSDGLIDRYETRKICFSCPEGLKEGMEKGISKAVGFELLWLKNKRGFYKRIAEEDDKRIEMLEERYNRSKQ